MNKTEYSNGIVVDIPVLGNNDQKGLPEMGELIVFAKDVEIGAISLTGGIDPTVRLILYHPGLRVPIERSGNALPISRARIKYPFLFLETCHTNPILYWELT